MKEVQWDERKMPDEWYAWRWFGFASHWTPQATEGQGASTVFIIFDTDVAEDGMTPTMMQEVAKSLQQQSDMERHQEGPLVVYELMLEPLLHFFDQALWSFRQPVRMFEKNRVKGNVTKERYTAMHELARHLIHATETLEATTHVINAMIKFQQSYRGGIPANAESFSEGASLSLGQIPTTGGRQQATVTPDVINRQHMGIDQLQETLSFYARYFAALQLRAGAFQERLRNEIKLVSDRFLPQPYDDHD